MSNWISVGCGGGVGKEVRGKSMMATEVMPAFCELLPSFSARERISLGTHRAPGT